MNDLLELQAELLREIPGLFAEMDAPDDPMKVWWLDLAHQERRATAQWKPGGTFGVSAPLLTPGYGEGPEEVFTTQEEARERHLLLQCDTCAGLPLSVLTDAQENALLIPVVSNPLWIGLNDTSTEGSFVWVNSEPFVFNNFSSGEPNNQNNEDCFEMFEGGTWNDAACANTRGYICELP